MKTLLVSLVAVQWEFRPLLNCFIGRYIATFLAAGVALSLTMNAVRAQTGIDWSDPQRLSSLDGQATRSSIVADAYGYVHAVWAESGLADEMSIIQYAFFDGERWSAPVDIYAAGRDFETGLPQLSIDSTQQLHLVFQEGSNSSVNYMTAAAVDALAGSARAWSQPLQIDVESYAAKLHVDDNGLMHLVYSNYYGSRPGLYYIRSGDGGISWTLEQWLDPDIPATYAPQDFEFQIDRAGTMHIAWWYTDTSLTAVPGRWIRYTHSTDGGDSWSTPLTIERDTIGDDHIRAASPVMTVGESAVHVMWAGGDLPYRNHAWADLSASLDAIRSTDAWRAMHKIPAFGELHGQAFDTMAVDGAGRIHFMGQIRYPAGIYHAAWDDGDWQQPTLAYAISEGIHAHNVELAVRLGNQLVVTFTDAPGEEDMRLYTIQATLDEVASTGAVALPVPAAPPEEQPSVVEDEIVVSEPSTTATDALAALPDQQLEAANNSNLLFWGVAPVALFLGLVLLIGIIRKRPIR